MKKILSLIVCIAIMLPLTAVPAAASGDADITYGILNHQYDAHIVGGLEQSDSLYFERANVTISYTQNGSTTVYPDAEKNKFYSATSDIQYKNYVTVSPVEGSPLYVDIKLNDTYTGSRDIDNMFLFMAKQAETAVSKCSVKLQYSTTDNPDVFTDVGTYDYDFPKEAKHFYLRLENSSSVLKNVSTIRFNFDYNGQNPLWFCEVDFNDKQDGATIVGKKNVVKKRITLSSLFKDNMVIQHGKSQKVTGTCLTENAVITLKLTEDATKNVVQTKTATVKDGKWEITLDPVNPGGPYTIDFSGPSSKSIKNVLFGEVWLAGGQSNMELKVSRFLSDLKKTDYEAPYGLSKEDQIAKLESDIASSQDSKFRLAQASGTDTEQPYYELRDITWKEAGPDTVTGYSATAFYFGRELRKMLGDDMPIGIVISAISSTGIEQWVSPEVINSDPDYDYYKGNVMTSARYNGMIMPLKDYNFKGTIWYQGEANYNKYDIYKKLFPDLIENWRTLFNNPDMPFLYVNLAPYKTYAVGFEHIREAQLETLMSVKNTGMAVITDSGHPTDIHPKDKSQAGYRLALAANALAYGSDNEYSGPIYKNMTANGNSLVINFDHSSSGLKVGAGADELRGFEVSADGTNYSVAAAEIVGNNVVVHSDSVKNPVAVRYGWKIDKTTIDSPIQATLYNNDDLPAAPFRATLNGFAINSVSYFDASGTNVDKDNINTDVLKFRINYNNNSNIGAKFVIGLYDKNNVLTGTKVFDAKYSYDRESEAEGTVDVDTKQGSISARVMAFDDLISLSPVCEIK